MYKLKYKASYGTLVVYKEIMMYNNKLKTKQRDRHAYRVGQSKLTVGSM